MKLNRKLMRIASAVFTVAITAGLSGRASAQDTRPRYSAPQYAEQAWTLPPDTVIAVQMNGTLSSRTARVGDKFTATVTVPVYVDGRTVIPAGSLIEGRVTQVTPAKRMNRSGTIGIDFDDLLFPNGTRVGLVGSLTSDDPETRKRIDDESRVSGQSNNRPAVFVGGGGAVGAVLGGIAGGGKGAAVGGAIGAGAGVASILLSKGEEAQVPSGTPFGVQIKQALTIRESFIAEGPAVSDRPADQPLDGQPDRTYRPDPVASQPDKDRPVPSRAREPEMRADADRASAAPELPLSSPEMVRRAQAALKEQGYYEGEADGVLSARTSGALRVYQREHNLPETGDLDPQTAKRLGITGTATAGSGSSSVDRTPERPRDSRTESPLTTDAVMATVLSASASRTQEGAISVLISTQANTGGWRWFGEQVVNGDTLEVYAKAIRPTGMVTQVLTRGRIELTVRDGVEYVRRVVIHSATGDQVITLGVRTDERAEPSGRIDPPAEPSRRTDARAEPGGRMDARAEPSGPSGAVSSAISLQRKADDLLAEYQRVYGVRMTGSGVEVDNSAQYREPEIELLFAIDSFANAAQLYARLVPSLRDRQSMRGATLAMARQARRTDRVLATTSSRAADSLATRWDSVRQDVLRLMQAHSISSSEIED